MNPKDILALVETIRAEKKIEREVVFRLIEEALVTAAQRRGTADGDNEYDIQIDRETGEVSAYCDGVPYKITDIIERTGAQTARQIIQQKLGEAVRDMIYTKYHARLNELVIAEVTRVDRGGIIFHIDDGVEAILPQEGKIRGEMYRVGERYPLVIETVDRETKRQGDRRGGRRPQITVSRKSPNLLMRLYERECPEIQDGLVEIVKCSRDPGRRAKIAVRALDSSMSRDDVVGCFLGVRNSRCNNVTRDLAGERIDVIMWSEDSAEFIMNALKPAQVDDVILCEMLDRAIVLVHPDQRSLAIGRHGQNVSLAKRLTEWELEIFTQDEEHHELDDRLAQAIERFQRIDGVSPELAEALMGQGFISIEDLTIIEIPDLMELGGLAEEQALDIVDRAAEVVECVDSIIKTGVSYDIAELLALNGAVEAEDIEGLEPAQIVEKFDIAPEQAELAVEFMRRKNDAAMGRREDRRSAPPVFEEVDLPEPPIPADFAAENPLPDPGTEL